MTGVILPFMNSALDPVVLIIYNTRMNKDIRYMTSALRNMTRCILRRKMTGVIFGMELNEYVNVREESPRPLEKTGSMSTPKNRTSVIEYKDSDVSSDSSCDSLQYRAYRHKSRRYR